MDRKKIIITAVMINAALLTVLFLFAMTMKEEPVLRQEAFVSDIHPISVQVPPVIETPAPLSSPPVVFTLPMNEEETPSAVVVDSVQPTQPAGQEVATNVEIEVQRGDTLEKIAKTYHTRVDEIIKLNQLPSSFLKIGQKLKIPSDKMSEARKLKPIAIPTPGESPEYYVMKVGDNPWSIAMKHHIKVDELLKLNGLNEKTARKLKPGDRLRIR